jgi:hypothetical protein
LSYLYRKFATPRINRIFRRFNELNRPKQSNNNRNRARAENAAPLAPGFLESPRADHLVDG